MSTLLWLKAVGTTLFMAFFFWGYFATLARSAGTAVVMPLTFIDAWVPFSTTAYPVYISLWVYVSLPAAFMTGFRPLAHLTLWISALCLSCLGVFWLYPTAVPPAQIDWSLYPELALIKGIDAAGNACPSLHVASAVFSAAWLWRQLGNVGAPTWLRWGSQAHCLLILWSTLATRQHVFLDVLVGTTVGLGFAWASLHLMGKRFGQESL